MEILFAGDFFVWLFTDVQGHWANKEIRYLVSHHIVDGTTETTFSPSEITTRAQIAKLLAEMLQLDTSESTQPFGSDSIELTSALGGDETGSTSAFSDVTASAWYSQYVAAVEKAGIFQGADGQFRPNDAISRQELAVVISRLIKTQETAANTVLRINPILPIGRKQE